jgi:TetR/AcrR family transcriptional regulator, mexJK operon transcriptional repressor
MKAWSDDHPKAKLMARNRAAILDAARDTFLRAGYEGASMEEIAAAAGVSIMTLYRHAASKDDLFAAVILSACDYSPEVKQADRAAMMHKPLKDVLVMAGVAFQEKLARPQTIALLRTVMMEAARFPQLAEAAYRGFIGAWEDNLDEFLAQRRELKGTAVETRRKLIAEFINRLAGADVLRMLLGLEGSVVKEHEQRASAAADELLSGLSAS